MTHNKQIGIWMDHSSAHFIEMNEKINEMNTIDSAFTHQDKEETQSRSENVMHNKEQHEQSEFYKKIGEQIRRYDEVLLFGPTDAKVELLNILRADHRFENIKIEVKQSDKMSENQQQAFVKEYFTK